MEENILYLVIQAENYLKTIEDSIGFLEKELVICNPDEKHIIALSLENLRIRYSQLLTKLVLLKAKNGIISNIKKLK